MKKDRKRKKPECTVDPHLLYEASVQDVDHALDFIERAFRTRTGRKMTVLREDFSGTAQMACDWALRGGKHLAYGVEIDPGINAWATTNNIDRLPEDARKRVHLIEGDVLTTTTPKADVITAFNFSYAIFKERRLLLDYFKRARSNLKRGGLFMVDCFAGPDMMTSSKSPRVIEAHRHVLGVEIPEFTYTWEQERFNLVDHSCRCHIHFKVRGRKKIKNAFSYDWRLWSIAELRDLMFDAGFTSVEVYADTWDEDAQDTDGVYRRRKMITDMDCIIPYIVAG